MGIPERFHASIFDVFERGNAERNIKGTGVGLAIVKRAAERAGGHVALKSKEGDGSEFIIILPYEESLPALAKQV